MLVGDAEVPRPPPRLLAELLKRRLLRRDARKPLPLAVNRDVCHGLGLVRWDRFFGLDRFIGAVLGGFSHRAALLKPGAYDGFFQAIRNMPVPLVTAEQALEVCAALGAVDGIWHLRRQQLDVSALEVGYLELPPVEPHEVPYAVGRGRRFAQLEHRGALGHLLVRRRQHVVAQAIAELGVVVVELLKAHIRALGSYAPDGGKALVYGVLRVGITHRVNIGAVIHKRLHKLLLILLALGVRDDERKRVHDTRLVHIAHGSAPAQLFKGSVELLTGNDDVIKTARVLFPQVQRIGYVLCVRPVGVIVAAMPDKHYVVGMVGFGVPILRVSGGVQVVLCQLRLRHVAVRGYELVYAPCNSAPRQVYVLAAALFQSDAFGVVPFVTPRRS